MIVVSELLNEAIRAGFLELPWSELPRGPNQPGLLRDVYNFSISGLL